MGPLTTTDLREELQRFTEEVLKRELREMGVLIRHDVRKELKNMVGPLQPSKQQARKTSGGSSAGCGRFSIAGSSVPTGSGDGCRASSKSSETSEAPSECSAEGHRSVDIGASPAEARGAPECDRAPSGVEGPPVPEAGDTRPDRSNLLDAAAEDVQASWAELPMPGAVEYPLTSHRHRLHSASEASRKTATSTVGASQRFQKPSCARPEGRGHRRLSRSTWASQSRGRLSTMTTNARKSILSRRLDIEGHRVDPEEGAEAATVLEAYPAFQTVVGTFIMLNALCVGYQVDHMARSASEEVPTALRCLEISFCVVFALELLLRLALEGWGFVLGAERNWNLFDAAVISLQLFEELLVIVQHAADIDTTRARHNWTFVRVLRILRLLRIIRLIRVVRFLCELRTIVASIASSLKCLFWTLVLLMLIVYALAIFFTQLVLDHRLEVGDAGSGDLLACWDSLGRSAMTLFQAITGGIDWDLAVTPLVRHISLALAPLFCLYIAFTMIALMNVVTGVFVENAIECANRDKENYLVHTVRELFEKADTESTGAVTWTEFQCLLARPEMQSYLKAIGVDVVSARGLFEILDLDHSGSIDADELLTGTLRLRGDAKAIDLAALIYETRWMTRRFKCHTSVIEEQIVRLRQEIGYLTDCRCPSCCELGITDSCPLPNVMSGSWAGVK